MATTAGVTIDFSALVQRADKLAQLSKGALDRVRTRTVATLRRGLKTEAARLLSVDVLNLTPRQIAPYLSVQFNGGAGGVSSIVLSGTKARLPLSSFGAVWGGRKTAGAVATLFRDSGAITFAHSFRIKGGGKAIWQRVPFTGAKFGKGIQRNTPSGLVQRLPIIVRKGPSFSRAVLSKKHGDIYPELLAFAGAVLTAEVARLVNVELK